LASPYHTRLLRLATFLILTVLATAVARAQDTIDTTTAGACASTGNPCVWTYHNDNARDGVNPNETILTPSLFTILQFWSNRDECVDDIDHS
jgi:hypothetical protein